MTQAFNLALLGNKVNTSGSLNAATGLYNATPVANGGTGAATLAANNVLLGNGTSAVQAVAPSTSGNVLTSNGTTWTSAAPTVSTTAVLNATAGASVGAVGSYAFLGETGFTATSPGATRAGSALRYVGLLSSTSFSNTTVAPYSASVSFAGGADTPAGTWRAMGLSYSFGSVGYGATLWLRIS